MRISRRLLLAALALAVPACGQGISVPAPLLDEQFNAGFPGFNWTLPATTGSGTTTQISGGVLAFTASAATSSSMTHTQMSFTNPNLSMAFQVAIRALAPGDQGAAVVQILDGTLTVVVASVTWDSPTQTLTYKIGGTTVGTGAAPPSDGTLNGFRFSVDSTGQATWFFSNVAQNTPVAVTAGPLFLQIGAVFGTGSQWPEVDFDSITVTRP